MHIMNEFEFALRHHIQDYIITNNKDVLCVRAFIIHSMLCGVEQIYWPISNIQARLLA